MRPFLSTCIVGVLIAGLLAGCASSSPATSDSFEKVTPAAYQPGSVSLTTQGGYEILSSEKEGGNVAVSLRSASREYVQFYVTAFNKSSDPRQISPQSIRLRFRGGSNQVMSAYTPSSVPEILKKDARDEARTAAELMQATRGAIYADRRGTSGTESNPAYGGGGSEEESPTEALLKPRYIVSGQRTGGFVYAPAPDVGAGQFVIQVPFGEEVHKFRYSFE